MIIFNILHIISQKYSRQKHCRKYVLTVGWVWQFKKNIKARFQSMKNQQLVNFHAATTTTTTTTKTNTPNNHSNNLVRKCVTNEKMEFLSSSTTQQQHNNNSNIVSFFSFQYSFSYFLSQRAKDPFGWVPLKKTTSCKREFSLRHSWESTNKQNRQFVLHFLKRHRRNVVMMEVFVSEMGKTFNALSPSLQQRKKLKPNFN